jgi:acyl-CoA thioester hydrolase
MDTSKINIASYTHSLPIQIRFADIDRQGHVNNATILSYFETGRVEFLNEIIGGDNDWDRRGLVIAHTEADYVEPVFLQDKIKTYSRIASIGTKSFKIDNLLVKEKNGKNIIVCIASFVLVCMDYQKKQTIEIPSDWKERFLKLIRG